MKNEKIIEELRGFKERRKYTLHDLSKMLDVQVTTISRWLTTKKINRVYASYLREKLAELKK
jgi:hypothetical protein